MPACPPSDEAPCWRSLSAWAYRQRYPYAPSFLPTSWTWLRRGLVPRAPAPGDRCGTGRTSGNSPWIDRTAYNDCSSGWSTSPDGAPWRSRIFLPCDRYSPLLVLTKRHAHLFEKSPTFLVDLWKDNLFPYPDVVIAPSIKGVRGYPAEITNPRQSYAGQTIQQLIHAITPQGHPDTHRHTLTDLEVRH